MTNSVESLNTRKIYYFSLIWKHHLVPQKADPYHLQPITLLLVLSNKPNIYLPIWLLEAICSPSTHFIKIYLGNHKKISRVRMKALETTQKAIQIMVPLVLSGDPFTVEALAIHSHAFWSLLDQVHASKKGHPCPGPVGRLHSPPSPGERESTNFTSTTPLPHVIEPSGSCFFPSNYQDIIDKRWDRRASHFGTRGFPK